MNSSLSTEVVETIGWLLQPLWSWGDAAIFAGGGGGGGGVGGEQDQGWGGRCGGFCGFLFISIF